MAKPFSPSVITANALLEGDVIYLNGNEWVRDLAQAEVFTEEQTANTRMAEAAAQASEVVGVYLIKVDTTDGDIRTTHFREAFRAKGPSNYAHGKQEQF